MRNGKHVLGLINTVLDIAPDRIRPIQNMTEYAIESVVKTVRAATESLTQNKKLTLKTSVDKSLPVGLRRRAAPHPGPAQPGRQRHQVHRHRRGARHGESGRRALQPSRSRHRSWHSTHRANAYLRTIPSSRYLPY